LIESLSESAFFNYNILNYPKNISRASRVILQSNEDEFYACAVAFGVRIDKYLAKFLERGSLNLLELISGFV
jgi:hypothetical protein